MTPKRKEISLPPNGKGAQAYLSRDLLEDNSCPLEVGGRAIAQLEPDVGVLLLPADRDRDHRVIPDE